jgi:Flp pilus assembly protein CpaB
VRFPLRPATEDTSAIPGRRPAWQRRWLRHRRLIAAGLAAVVVWSLATALAPAAPATTPVVVAAGDLVPGTVITEADVRRDQRAAAPDDASADPGPLLGRTVAFPVRAGEPVLARHVLGADLLAGYPAGTVATAVPLGDSGVTPSLAPGDLVDVIAATAADLDTAGAGTGTGTGAAGAATVARGVRVLLAPTSGSVGEGLLGRGTAGSAALVVAASTEQALAIAQAGVRSRLTVVLRGRS